MNMTEILNQAETAPLTKAQIVALLNTDNHSPAFTSCYPRPTKCPERPIKTRARAVTLWSPVIVIVRMPA